MDEEIRQLLRERAGLRDRYEEIRAAAEARVSEWRWTTGHVHKFELPLEEELFSPRRGRLLRARPAKGATTRVGLDTAGGPVAILHFANDTGQQTTTELFALGDDAFAGFSFFRPPWRPPGEHLDGTSLVRIARDESGRPASRIQTLDWGDQWRRERYQYDHAGRCLTIEQDGAEGRPWHYEASYASDGRLARIDAVAVDGTRSTAYVHLGVALSRALEQVETALFEHVSAVLNGASREPLWALALAYEAEAPMPPTITVCTQRERESWRVGGDDWWLTNPAEWKDEGVTFGLPDPLEDRCRAVSAALEAEGQAAKGVALLHRVARAHNTGPVLVFAREVHGDRERDDLRRSLPAHRFDELRSAGIL